MKIFYDMAFNGIMVLTILQLLPTTVSEFGMMALIYLLVRFK